MSQFIPVIEAGVSTGVSGAKELYQWTMELMNRELNRYDFEKVTVQSAYGIGIFLSFKVMYHLYVSLKYAAFVATHPLEGLSGWLAGMPILGDIINLIDQAYDDGVVTDEEWHEMWVAHWEADPVHYAKPFMEDYWFFVCLGILGVFALAEKKRIDKNKRLTRTFIKRHGAK